jgi:GDP-L-fucose synthase
MINSSQLTDHSKIVVFGGTGLVGSAIIRKLLEKGYKNILVTYNKTNPEKIYSQITAHRSQLTDHSSQLTPVKVNLTRQADVESFFEQERPEYVFLAAAKVGGILANNTYPADFIYTNIMIQTNVIHAAWKYGVKKLLFLGSSCIYPKFAPQPMKEEYLLTGELEPTNEPYAVAKIAGIKMCQAYNRQYRTDFISVMPTNLYGPNDNFDLVSSHVLPALIRKFHLAKLLAKGDFEQIRQDFMTYGNREIIINGRKISINENTAEEEILLALAHFGITSSTPNQPNEEHQTLSISRFSRLQPSTPSRVTVTLWGSGEVFREFLHVDDLADACVFLMFNLHTPVSNETNQINKTNQINQINEANSSPALINIGTGKDITIKELAEMVKEIVGFEGDINWDSTKPDGTPRKLLDVSKLRSLGWEEKIKFADGIRQTYEWYLSHASTH